MRHTPKDFFISYHKTDRPMAEWIAWQLEQASFSVVIQAWDFLPGTNFVLKMQEAATEAERTIAVISNDYLNALYTQPEWTAAFVQDPISEKATLLPILVGQCKLEGLLASLIYIDLVGQEESIACQRLLDGVKRSRAKPKIAPVFPGNNVRAQIDISPKSISDSSPEKPPFSKRLQPLGRAIELFYCYAPEDEELRAHLEKHLALLKQLGLITDWHGGKISAGQEKTREIEKYWNTSQIILLLISADFMASNEFDMVRQAMERYKTGTARVIPILLRPVDWDGSLFDKLTVLPTNKKPVVSWIHREEAFLNIAKGIRNVVEEISS